VRARVAKEAAWRREAKLLLVFAVVVSTLFTSRLALPCRKEPRLDAVARPAAAAAGAGAASLLRDDKKNEHAYVLERDEA
jgi:hypothetical protein